jgi:hypothetical protein
VYSVCPAQSLIAEDVVGSTTSEASKKCKMLSIQEKLHIINKVTAVLNYAPSTPPPAKG